MFSFLGILVLITLSACQIPFIGSESGKRNGAGGGGTTVGSGEPVLYGFVFGPPGLVPFVTADQRPYLATIIENKLPEGRSEFYYVEANEEDSLAAFGSIGIPIPAEPQSGIVNGVMAAGFPGFSPLPVTQNFPPVPKSWMLIDSCHQDSPKATAFVFASLDGKRIVRKYVGLLFTDSSGNTEEVGFTEAQTTRRGNGSSLSFFITDENLVIWAGYYRVDGDSGACSFQFQSAPEDNSESVDFTAQGNRYFWPTDGSYVLPPP